ncbi:hypothetical protein H0H92_009955 [Tricholoma furcatifolium]|nr:hypothetical protein H0H92_009955 [Tricholoma furcatifolium]
MRSTADSSVTLHMPSAHAFANLFKIRELCNGLKLGLFVSKTIRFELLAYPYYVEYEFYGTDIISAIGVWPQRTALLLADAAAIKEVSTYRSRFPKPVQRYSALTFFGRNIVASEGEEWKKYRKISAPAFSDRNNKMVWDETVKIMDSLFQDVWDARDIVETEHCVEITLPIALFVIGAAGFGRTISWKDDDIVPAGHQLTFKNALHIVTTDVFLKLIVPERALGLTKRLRDVRLAFEELERYMLEMIQERQASTHKEARYDLFSSLLDANDADSEDAKLSVSELVAGNIFIFLVAGHETTAHTLCFTFAMLALYQDEQEILYQHIQSVLAAGKLFSPELRKHALVHPVYGVRLIWQKSLHPDFALSVFYETLRMFPPVEFLLVASEFVIDDFCQVTGIPKFSSEDTTLSTIDAAGNKVIVAVPKDAEITIDVPGLHYNPRYWEDPHAFKPSRFLKSDWPRDAFLPFSAGLFKYSHLKETAH